MSREPGVAAPFQVIGALFRETCRALQSLIAHGAIPSQARVRGSSAAPTREVIAGYSPACGAGKVIFTFLRPQFRAACRSSPM